MAKREDEETRLQRLKTIPESYRERDPRLPYEPTDEERLLVSAAAANGMTPQVIAKMLNISLSACKEQFAYELENAENDILTRATSMLYRKIFFEQSESSLHFFLKTKGGFVETKRTEHSGVINNRHSIDYESLEPHEREMVKQLIQNRIAAEERDVTPSTDDDTKEIKH